MKVVVANILNSPIAAFHNEGLQVYSLLEEAVNKKERVEISFEGISRCATQFLNASIGKLYLLHEPNQVDNLLVLDFGQVPHLKEKVEEVRDNAIHSKEYDNLIHSASA